MFQAMGYGQCTCGRMFVLIQAGEAATRLSRVLQNIEHDTGECLDVHTLGPELARCSGCSTEIRLPAVETLDLDRFVAQEWRTGLPDGF